MSENTAISWTDATFNPWEGCQKVGPGCDHCYAETRNARYAGGTAINWGPGAPRRRTSISNWRKPIAWNAGADAFEREHGRRRRVFCASLADVFDNAVDPQWRADLFELIAKTPRLDWLLLTKRIGNVGNMQPVPFDFDKLYPNVWLGISVVNQAEADRDIPTLLATPARARFLSIEPMLGPISLRWLAAWPENPAGTQAQHPSGATDHLDGLRRIDWVIVGGESGPGARPMHPDWALSLRDQCAAAGVPFHFKQWGEWQPISQQEEAFTNSLFVSNQKAAAHEDQSAIDELFGRRCTVEQTVQHLDGSMHHFLEPNAFPPGAMTMYRVGKKDGGRLLDGIEHNGFPIGGQA